MAKATNICKKCKPLHDEIIRQIGSKVVEQFNIHNQQVTEHAVATLGGMLWKLYHQRHNLTTADVVEAIDEFKVKSRKIVKRDEEGVVQEILEVEG